MNMSVLQYYFSMKALLLWVLMVFVQTSEYMGCLEEERIDLLHLKSFLIISIRPLKAYNSDYLLPSWVNHEKSDCCGWERVTCNSTTGHLRSLDLSFDAINGCIWDEGFEKLSTLRNLEILNLGYNFFDDNSILQSLGAITSLKTLNLSWNHLEGYFPAEVMLRNLNTLDISFERLEVLKNLETLILDDNWFDDSIIPSLSNLTSLVTLSLEYILLGYEQVKAVEGNKKVIPYMYSYY
ncbi:hypothetical protein I3843_12G038800 [Carya illinoinensis]|nr:hypothetical protein I3843_12G038800 [Carya illinoinensis]